MQLLKRILDSLIKSVIINLRKFTYGAYFIDNLTYNVLESNIVIKHNDVELVFATPNRLCTYRAKSFSEKEPETLAWIDSLEEGCVLWDIGANVGLYSIYAARTRDCNVFSFEPSVFNLEFLVRNIYLNNLIEKITVIPLPLNDRIAFSSLKMTSTEWGGALSSFDHNVGFDGSSINQVFEYKMSGVSLDSIINNFSIPQPHYIKMDVDGIEHFILKGGHAVLSNIKGILIEVNDDFVDQANQCEMILRSAGLKLHDKRHGEVFDLEDSKFNNCFNQIWVR